MKGKLLNRPFVSKRVASAAETLLLPGQGWHKYWNGLGIPEEKIVDVGQCSLDMSMREHNDLGYEDPVVLYLGRIIERKGLDVLIRALSQVDTNATLVVGGMDRFATSAGHLPKKSPLTSILSAVSQNLKSAITTPTRICSCSHRVYAGTTNRTG